MRNVVGINLQLESTLHDRLEARNLFLGHPLKVTDRWPQFWRTTRIKVSRL
jgi:hypothetical protein